MKQSDGFLGEIKRALDVSRSGALAVGIVGGASLPAELVALRLPAGR